MEGRKDFVQGHIAVKWRWNLNLNKLENWNAVKNILSWGNNGVEKCERAWLGEDRGLWGSREGCLTAALGCLREFRDLLIDVMVWVERQGELGCENCAGGPRKVLLHSCLPLNLPFRFQPPNWKPLNLLFPSLCWFIFITLFLLLTQGYIYWSF